jgi:hypothetical protein
VRARGGRIDGRPALEVQAMANQSADVKAHDRSCVRQCGAARSHRPDGLDLLILGIAALDSRRVHNDLYPRGSGRKWKHCHGTHVTGYSLQPQMSPAEGGDPTMITPEPSQPAQDRAFILKAMNQAVSRLLYTGGANRLISKKRPGNRASGGLARSALALYSVGPETRSTRASRPKRPGHHTWAVLDLNQ